MNVSRQAFRSNRFTQDSAACLICQWRRFSISTRRPGPKAASSVAPSPSPLPTSNKPVSPPSPLEDAPRSYGKAVDEFTPKPLSRPIGLPHPPAIGDNRGIDTRSWKQRRDDFVDYDKHLVRREQLKQKMATPYFREWSNMRMHKGKSFLAPPRLFKGERALYFPNFYGQTLQKDKVLRDTTPVLEGKVSVVSVFSSQWAENQANTFVSAKENEVLNQLVKSNPSEAQLVRINIEDNSLKAWLIRLFMGRLRAQLGESQWGKYFLVRNEITTDIRDAVGLLNSKVGYTYLLDGECKIRWAGSGPAEGDEKDGLTKGVRRLIEEAKGKKPKASVLSTGTTVEGNDAALPV